MSVIPFAMAAEQAKVTYRQADSWVRKGYITAIGVGGTGNPREITDEEAAVMAEMGRLTRIGLLAGAAERAARELLFDGTAILGDYVLTNGSRKVRT